jgi:starch phosphorylase
MGRTLGNSLVNLGLLEPCQQALADLAYDFERIREAEWDAGLGNGGLGRLAACFLDSLATLELPSYGYGLRYDYGIFHQRIVNGAQLETPDGWLRYGNPWEIARTGDHFRVRFGGRVHQHLDAAGRLATEWLDTEDVLAVPYDTPVPGYRNDTVNTLRLWSARATEEFDLRYFNEGDYLRAVEDKAESENITKVLYPNDNVSAGRELRLRQEYLFVSATLQDIIRRYKKHYLLYDDQKGLRPFDRFAERTAIQLNDTHPALAVPELMRILLDEAQLGWDTAWDLTRRTLAYTNHTLLPEALETWKQDWFALLLPRQLEIVHEIDRRLLEETRARHPGDEERAARVSLVSGGEEPRIRMANLAIVGSHSTNGVARIHSGLLKTSTVKDLAELYPERFNNKTNGITPRRWLLLANPALAEAITGAIGEGWITDLTELRRLEKLADDRAFRAAVARAKSQAKRSFVRWLADRTGQSLDPDSVFDCQVKRIHEYKRQLLNVLRVIVLYNRLREGRPAPSEPRTFIFAGKAAPAYTLAKLIIKLVNNLAGTIDGDAAARGRLKVVFLPEYCVSLAERLIPASDVSNQISTAGYEASGTSNMKFMLNGALTIGTRDGATIEMAEEAGEENFFLFGLTAEQVAASRGWYSPHWHRENEPETRAALDLIASDHFSRYEPGVFAPLLETLLDQGDHYMHLADLGSYLEADARLVALREDPDAWTRRAILNIAGSGAFSSDRTIAEYASEIWGARPCPVGDPPALRD